MSRELSLYEAMGGTYRSVDGILYPNISVGGEDDTLSIRITDVGKYGLIWIVIHTCISFYFMIHMMLPLIG